eukprot:RCo019470
MNIICFDLSKRAIELLKGNEGYKCGRIHAFVHDISTSPLAEELVPECCVDFVLMIFILSAVPAQRHCAVFQNVAQKLKPGGFLFFRDYAVDDLAQKRFRSSAQIDLCTWKRKDGTRSYFFHSDYLGEVLRRCGFSVCALEYVKKTVTNVKEGKEMARTWIQANAKKL